MSSRKLGGGRVLGSGKTLAPPAPATRRNGGRISPSESTLSSSTTASPLVTSILPDSEQDLIEKVSLNHGRPSKPAAGKLLCPICEEEMMTLLQLNRHLDDNHQELPEIEQDEIKTWFDRQVNKAKKFQPLAVINQKLKGLDVFESNDSPTALSTPLSGSRISTPEPSRPDPDEVVTRAHWQKPGYSDMCTEPACGKRLGAVNGNVNCRHCGRLFCEDHTMYQMKLARSAQHEPVRGFWCRVCETCYKSREGYNDHHGLITDHTNDFMAIRRKIVDKAYLEIGRLEKRLTKLTQSLASAPEEASNETFLSLAGPRSKRKHLEQSVVTWEDDTLASKCPFCQQEFSTWSFRRHHCRLCGRVVCADPRTDCSTEVGLNVQAATENQLEKSITPVNVQSNNIPIDIRMCINCRSTLFSKSDFKSSLALEQPSQRAYLTLLQFERGIRLLLPNFHRLLGALQDPDVPPSPQQLSEASKVRKRLIDSFGKYDIAAKRLRDLPTGSETQKRLQKAVYLQSSNFLHLHMLPLKSLPKILKHATPSSNLTGGMQKPPVGALASIQFNNQHGSKGGGGGDSSSQLSIESSTALSAMESEEKELKERLIVLEEQRFLVRQMMEEAAKKRRFDEVAALRGNLEEVEKEISVVEGEVGGLDWGTVYGKEGHKASGGASNLDARGGSDYPGMSGWMGFGNRR